VDLAVREDVLDSLDLEEHAQGLARVRDSVRDLARQAAAFCRRARALQQVVLPAGPPHGAVATSVTRRPKKAR
jgi:hypothetical protein